MLKSQLPSFLQTLLKYHMATVSCPRSLLQTGQLQISQPVLTVEMIHPLDHFYGLLLNMLQKVHISAVGRTGHNTHQHRVEDQMLVGVALIYVQVSLDGIPFLKHLKCITWFGVIQKLAESLLDPTADVIDKDIKWHRFQY